MNAVKFVYNTYLCYFSRPAAERTLYKLLCHTPVQSLVEVGLSQPQRSRRLLNLAVDKAKVETVRYTAIDLFEARPQNMPGVSLKEAHRLLAGPRVKLQLVPGDPFSALARAANTLLQTDVLIIYGQCEGESLERAWFYVPRMLHDRSHVLLEQPGPKAGERQFVRLSRLEIERLASLSARTLRRAA